jgi:hypothetical protein
MTRPEQPQPYPGDLVVAVPGAVPYRRIYRDAIGRPLTGKVTLTGKTRHTVDGLVVVPAPVEVELVDGALAVDLPPDDYDLAAELRTADGRRVTDADTVTVSSTD